MVAKNNTNNNNNNNNNQTYPSKYPKNKQDNRNKHTFTNSNNNSNEVGEFKGGIFIMPGDKKIKNSIEESRPRTVSENTLVIRDFKDGYFIERTRTPSPNVSRKKNSEKKIDSPVLLTPAHLRSQSLPQTFIPEKKSQTRKVQDFILSSQNIVVPNISNSPLLVDLSYSPPNSPEKWAGGAYTNSPPPKHLPCPQF